MTYENARDVLPDGLLKEIQKYAGGKLLYIPVDSENKNWGELSGYRQKLLKRNVIICNKYRNGATVSQLADEFCLSLDSVKKIVYGKKDRKLFFTPFLSSAISYASEGLSEEWVRMYYEFCEKKSISGIEETIIAGVLKIPLRLVEFPAIQGSSEVGGEVDDVDDMNDVNIPLIVHYQNMHFYVRMQTDMLAALKRKKVNAYPAFIIVPRGEEYRIFMKNFGRHFIGVQ